MTPSAAKPKLTWQREACGGVIELEMIFALGFLAATLLGLLGLPVVLRRARRLATARLQRQMPLLQTDIVAERDQRRATHAVEVRQREQRIEALDTRLGTAMAETGRHATRIVSLEAERDDKAGTIAALEAALSQSRQRATDAEATVTAQAGRLAALQDSHATDAATIAQLQAETQVKASQARDDLERQTARLAELESTDATVTRLDAALAAALSRAASAETAAALQTERLCALEESHAASSGTNRRLEAELGDAQSRAVSAETQLAAQEHRTSAFQSGDPGGDLIASPEAISADPDHSTTGVEAVTGAQAAALQARLTAAETLAADQRIMLAELERQLAGQTILQGRPRSERGPPDSLTDDTVQLRATLARFRAEQDVLRQGLVVATDERDRLRFRVDELLLTIEDLEDKVEEAADQSAQARQDAAQQASAVASLAARLAAAEKKPSRRGAAGGKSVRAAVGPSGLRAGLGSGIQDAAALREAVASLAADLVGFANRSDGTGGS